MLAMHALGILFARGGGTLWHSASAQIEVGAVHRNHLVLPRRTQVFRSYQEGAADYLLDWEPLDIMSKRPAAIAAIKAQVGSLASPLLLGHSNVKGRRDLQTF